jgi:hypothetical protein
LQKELDIFFNPLCENESLGDLIKGQVTGVSRSPVPFDGGLKLFVVEQRSITKASKLF